MEKSAVQWMVEPLRKYAAFNGRARRSEYWWFQLFISLISLMLLLAHAATVGFASAMSAPTGPGNIFTLAILVPVIAVSVRRLHDIDRSGWWLLLLLVPVIGAIVLLFWHCQHGTVGENRYGMDPIAR